MMKKNLKLTELGKLSEKQIMFFLIAFLGPIFLFVFNDANYLYKFFTLLITFSSTLMLIVHYWKHKKINKFPLKYSWVIHLQLLLLILLIPITVYKNSNFLIYPTLVFLFAFLFNIGIFLYYISNIFYMNSLKKRFPFEKKEKEEIQISNRNLSRYINLEQQKIYFNLQIGNFLIYFIVVSFLTLLLMKQYLILLNASTDVFTSWLIRQENVSLFNMVSLISLTIAIYSVTIPTQSKIIKKAEEAYRQHHKI